MNIKQGFVLVIGVVAAWCLIENPPMMAGVTQTAATVVDVQRLHDYLAADALISLLLLVLLMRLPGKAKPADIQLCPRCHELHPVGRLECADSHLPDVAENYRSAYLIPDPVTQEYRPVGMSTRALMMPFAVVMALVLLGCVLYVTSLESPSERPAESRQSNLSQR